jgi:hypothetical protein
MADKKVTGEILYTAILHYVLLLGMSPGEVRGIDRGLLTWTKTNGDKYV